MAILELENVSKTYGRGGVAITALKAVNLKVNKGDFIAIVGRSGSGKSTLLNILGCIDLASSGKYLIEGIDVRALNDKNLSKIRNKKIGFVLQYFGLINDYTVYENIEIPLKYAKENKNYKERILELLKKMGIEDKRNKYPCELSGGQNQRVAIARALANNPNIILADEPTGALDKKTSIEIMELLCELNKFGKTIIMVTHDEEVYNYCNRRIIIEDGVLNEYNDEKK